MTCIKGVAWNTYQEEYKGKIILPTIVTAFETVMIICFGLSWPFSVYKSWKSRTTKGKSLLFEIFLWIGYVFGISKNFILYANGTNSWIFFLGWGFYFVNFAMITIDMILYFRNARLDKLATK